MIIAKISGIEASHRRPEKYSCSSFGSACWLPRKPDFTCVCSSGSDLFVRAHDSTCFKLFECRFPWSAPKKLFCACRARALWACGSVGGCWGGPAKGPPARDQVWALQGGCASRTKHLEVLSSAGRHVHCRVSDMAALLLHLSNVVAVCFATQGLGSSCRQACSQSSQTAELRKSRKHIASS